MLYRREKRLGLLRIKYGYNFYLKKRWHFNIYKSIEMTFYRKIVSHLNPKTIEQLMAAK